MNITRRGFLKLSGATAAGAALGGLGLKGMAGAANVPELAIKSAKETTSVCGYCSVGCSLIVHTANGKVINMEGDPDSPINEGTLCSKGQAIRQIADSPWRIVKPLYRAPGADKWEEKSWDWCLDQIAEKIKAARDAGFQEKSKLKTKDKDGKETETEVTVNRCNSLASCGSAAMDNEECYLYQKWLRSLGLVYIEHQARI
jgi:formate dehydrogenase major subunit